jgi:hypothetical protein
VYEDKTITCADCGQAFTFSASEQAFYAEKGFSDAPKRCKSCRQSRKAQRNTGSYGGDDSYGGGSSSYGGGGCSSSYGGYSSGGGCYDRAPRQMYEALRRLRQSRPGALPAHWQPSRLLQRLLPRSAVAPRRPRRSPSAHEGAFHGRRLWIPGRRSSLGVAGAEDGSSWLISTG